MYQVCWCHHNSWQHREGPCQACERLMIHENYDMHCSRFTFGWENDLSFPPFAMQEMSYGLDYLCFCGHPQAHHGSNSGGRPCERTVDEAHTIPCGCPHFILLHHDRIVRTPTERVWPFAPVMASAA